MGYLCSTCPVIFLCVHYSYYGVAIPVWVLGLLLCSVSFTFEFIFITQRDLIPLISSSVSFSLSITALLFNLLIFVVHQWIIQFFCMVCNAVRAPGPLLFSKLKSFFFTFCKSLIFFKKLCGPLPKCKSTPFFLKFESAVIKKNNPFQQKNLNSLLNSNVAGLVHFLAERKSQYNCVILLFF